MGICIRYEEDKEDAAALLNKGFLKILNNIGKYRKDVPFEAWIKRIMINTGIDEYRKNRKTKELVLNVDLESMEYLNTQVTVDFNLIEDNINVEELEFMLKSLNKELQMVFNLYEIDGFSHKEIADKLGISERTSKRYLSTARTTLREMLIKATVSSDSSEY
ncbi:MAG: RNA polymerase sigma factor [Flavobacteriales bacterium]|nr:RNA polymerase sigma factor [Flavobacteriales bacterium]